MRFFVLSASDNKAANPALFSLEIGECGLSRATDLFVAIIGESLECPDRRRRGRQPQRFYRRCPQRRRLPAEQTTARLGKRDERLHGGRTPDASQREHQLTLDALISFLFH